MTADWHPTPRPGRGRFVHGWPASNAAEQSSGASATSYSGLRNRWATRSPQAKNEKSLAEANPLF